MLLRIIILFFLTVSLTFCNHQSGKREQLPLTIKHVFVSGVPDKYGSRADIRHDFYYVYNYKTSDFPFLRSILDTLFIDTVYKYHWYHFLLYNEELPDTLSLSKEMEDEYGYELEKDPGSGKFRKHYIIDYYFGKSYTSQMGNKRKFPDNYSITVFKDGKGEENYYLKDSVSGKLVEVDRSVVLP